MFRLRSLRLRIAAAFILGSIVVTGLVGFTTYTLISQTLQGSRRTAVMEQSFQGIRTARDLLQRNPSATTADIVTRLQRRGDVIVRHDGEWGRSSHVIDQNLITSDLRRSVRTNRPAFQSIEEPNRLMFGSLVPRTDTEVYFVYSNAGVDRTLALVSRIFFVVIGVAAAIAGLAGFRLADGVIRPLRLASEAAHEVAEGNLDTRLEVKGDDELARLSAAFNQMTEALSTRIAREQRFVGDVSHELRTPLTALKTSIDYLANRSDDLPDRLRAPLGMAADEVRSLQRLVDDLLELSRMEAGTIVVQAEDIDLAAFASELVRRRAPEADVRIHGDSDVTVWTDKMRLERVVGNLLENAVFHGGDGGVDITLGRTNGVATITVSDSGPGIAADKLPQIFERFYRGDESRRRDGRTGAGLGLAIARENAHLIGADIGVNSEVGHGTRFEVHVPDAVPL